MRDPKAEAWLQSEGVRFRYEAALPLAKVDLKRSRDNQARPTDWKLPEEIERYALSMIEGDDFPCQIVYEGPDGYVHIDGNQRCCAMLEIERAAFDALVVEEADRLVLLRLTLEANGRLNGIGQTAAEVLQQAKIFKLHHPTVPLTEIAKGFRIKLERLEDAIRQDETTSRLGQVGVSVVGLSTSILRMLHGVEADPVLAEVGRLTQEAGLTVPLVQELVTEVRRARSERAQLAVVERWRKRDDIARRIRLKRAGVKDTRIRQRRLFTMLSTLIHFVEKHPSADALELTAPEHLAKLKHDTEHLVVLVNGVLGDGVLGDGASPARDAA